MNKAILILLILILGIFETQALTEGQEFDVGDGQFKYRVHKHTNGFGEYLEVVGSDDEEESFRGLKEFKEQSKYAQLWKYFIAEGVVDNGILYLLYKPFDSTDDVILKVNGFEVRQLPFCKTKEAEYPRILSLFDKKPSLMKKRPRD